SLKTIAATGEKIMNSPANIDYTITSNGLDLGDPELTVKSIANGYAGVDSRLIEVAHKITTNQGRIGQNVNVGEIKAGDGQGQALREERDTIVNAAVVAAVDTLDEVDDSGVDDYLTPGCQAIIDERKTAGQATVGEKTMLE